LSTVEWVLIGVLVQTRLIDGLSSPLNSQDNPSSEAMPTPSITKKELQYISVLNRMPSLTIRIVAWSPVASTFSARFACKYRHYTCFFHSRNLDILRMQDAPGEHDFWNLCELDASKQITNFRRTILQGSISPAQLEARPCSDGVWAFDPKGTASLYNQVRPIVVILFLIGAGFEHPSPVTALVNVHKESPYPAFEEGGSIPPVVDGKPEYQMADGLHLVLWGYAYSDNDVGWRIDEGDGEGGGAGGAGGCTDS
jgi:tRNA pseudouridine38/39 synthase